MALCINQAGTYRNITTLCINQAGTYRNITTGFINQAGTYRNFGFIPQPGALGSSFGCGILICKPGSSPAWIVAPGCANIVRTWYFRNDAVTVAQNCAGSTFGWFVPTRPQLQNPGYLCRSFWGGPFSGQSDIYWSSTQMNTSFACLMRFGTGPLAGISYYNSKVIPTNLRAFRCVTY